MKFLNIALATALLATGGAAAAQTAGDGQCILVSNAFASQAKDEQARKVAEASIYFYLGRIGNQATPAQLKALLDAQAKTLTNATAGTIMNKCAAAVQSKVELLQSLAPKAKPAPAKPAQSPGR